MKKTLSPVAPAKAAVSAVAMVAEPLAPDGSFLGRAGAGIVPRGRAGSLSPQSIEAKSCIAQLQAINEALTTVNRQLQMKVADLEASYSDITDAKRSAQAAAAAQRAMAASLEDRVRERTAQLRALTAELALTEERERRVLARDLHDDLGQLLAIIKIKLTSLEESERRGALKGPLQEIEALVDQANRSARSLMLQLSPPALQALGLVPALEWLGEEMERIYGLSVRIDKEGDLPALEEPARTTIFRAIRELLINVAKHAQTNVAQINCDQPASGQLSISVTDQGLGFDSERALSSPAKDSGFGLISVRERIEFIGGRMTVDTKPGYGTTITIVFPAEPNV